MLTGKQKSFLRGMLNTMTPVFQVGKGGITENLLKQLDEVLEARELIKITVLNNQVADPDDIAQEIATQTGAEVVQVIGNKIGLYREAKKKQINLPL
ncbi:MAG TPA: ribosome assembly RNA-binding protein YhbY [Firmicutes bacterium]|jgi:RNA-binding protein|nr:ribosome assembly RNA-binding protein YhbY [Bacillota bacterium]HBT17394.1 ribosome assembly RNA-binding protein YhbY [Bacillota bacterium]